ncbi:uncharacterized protein CIMG_03936 [Coccidioides immitis RS]|uniref:Uncharacterized protein n=3 Tax=Coccidioides immitis TaxID=5501 RepID=A0A0E1RYL3_COCIM|nr:uncharacterized protein CIMG_03936 [Coccidioides immitis RS]EAS32912.1 hypothetical protein CIMG_03936 [Coccidioides immitis RS]KMP08187.1 hypothetical protein CIRG_07868 [Coccidioides immitis RMSCC 2394]KMU89893.1 hypothetical protein CIHG_07576 [Coccidioides immitis H538.4]
MPWLLSIFDQSGRESGPDADLIVDAPRAMIQTELLRKDGRFQLKGSNKFIFVLLPDITTAPVIHIAPSAVQAVRTSSKIPILHPSALLLTKRDMEAALRWLVSKRLRIDFDLYPEKPKEHLIPALKLLYARMRQTMAAGLGTILNEMWTWDGGMIG